MVDNYDKTVDVVVVGYGLAGAVAAISAHDAGSEVLILEKAKHPGGCSILAGGSIFMVRNVENAIKYFSALSGGRVSSDIIEAFAYGLAENLDYIKQLAKVDGATVKLKEKNGLYPFPGNKDSFGSVWITQVPGFTGFPNVKSTLKNGQMMFKVLMDNLDARNIPVYMNTPSKELIVDRDSAITGVKAERE
ncbi:MAG: FAD-binding protein, partial [Deltaproteobacteria bacterium]|nr:FAD-binding protein [Deltaproteobacteria bacterium]